MCSRFEKAWQEWQGGAAADPAAGPGRGRRRAAGRAAGGVAAAGTGLPPTSRRAAGAGGVPTALPRRGGVAAARVRRDGWSACRRERLPGRRRCRLPLPVRLSCPRQPARARFHDANRCRAVEAHCAGRREPPPAVEAMSAEESCLPGLEEMPEDQTAGIVPDSSRPWAAGGMGTVFQAQDVQLERLVALKVMKPALAADELGRRRFCAKPWPPRRSSTITSPPSTRRGRGPGHALPGHGVPGGREPGRPAQAGRGRLPRSPTSPATPGRPCPSPRCCGLPGRSPKGWRPPTHARADPPRHQAGQRLAGNHGVDPCPRVSTARGTPSSRWGKLPGAGRGRWLELPKRLSPSAVAFGRVEDPRFRPGVWRIERRHLTSDGHYFGHAGLHVAGAGQRRQDRCMQRCDLFSLGCVLYRMCTGRMAFAGFDLNRAFCWPSSRQQPNAASGAES